MQPLIFTDDHILNCGLAALLYNLQQHPVFLCACVLLSQDQAFGELEKNSDKILQGTSSSDSSQPAHLHELLCSLQKQLLAYCHINCVTEVLAQLNVYHEQTWISISNRPCIILVSVIWFSSVCESVFVFFRAPVVLRSSINTCSYYCLTPQISITVLQHFWEKALETAVCVRSYEVYSIYILFC